MNEIAVRQDTTALVTMIERVALTPEADLAKLEKLIDMQERVLNREAEMAYAAAMSRVQAEMPQVVKNAENTQTHSTYATLDAICRAVIPIASSNGFALSFGTAEALRGEERRITCVVSHEGGHHKDYFVDLPVDATGIGGKVNKTPIHAVKSAITYGRNILTTLIFNVALTDEDDDGNSAGTVAIDEAQQREIESLLTATSSDREKFLTWIGAPNLAEIPARKYQQAVTMLRRKLKTSPPSAPPPPSVASAQVDPGAASSGPPGAGEEGTPGRGDPVSSPADTRIDKETHRKLEAWLKKVGVDREWVKQTRRLDHLDDLTQADYADLKATLLTLGKILEAPDTKALNGLFDGLTRAFDNDAISGQDFDMLAERCESIREHLKANNK